MGDWGYDVLGDVAGRCQHRPTNKRQAALTLGLGLLALGGLLAAGFGVIAVVGGVVGGLAVDAGAGLLVVVGLAVGVGIGVLVGAGHVDVGPGGRDVVVRAEGAISPVRRVARRNQSSNVHCSRTRN